jgi:magnesium chelatase family protein
MDTRTPVSSIGALTTVRTVTLVGVDAVPVRVECTVAQGLPGLRVVGLPDGAVRESGERVRAAIKRAGLRWPAARIVVNLAPADLPKAGAGFDLPLALAILAASAQLDARPLAELWVHGEVGLDGTLRGVPAALAVAVGARRLGARRLLVPEDGAGPLRAVTGLDIVPARDLAEAVALVAGRSEVRAAADDGVDGGIDGGAGGAGGPGGPGGAGGAGGPGGPGGAVIDLADVRGQPVARRAVEVAAVRGVDAERVQRFGQRTPRPRPVFDLPA